MQVVAIKPAFFNGSLIKLGEKADIPENTKGSWFAPPESPQAQAAMRIKASGSTPVRVLDKLARGEAVDLTDPKITEPRTLSEGWRVKPASFVDLMRGR